MNVLNLNCAEINSLASGEHCNPHQFLGIRREGKKKNIVVWRPEANEAYVEVKQRTTKMEQIDGRGLFFCSVDDDVDVSDYKVYHSNGMLSYDPYSFLPTISDVDIHFFSNGVHYELYKILGSNFINKGIQGVSFAVWAPNAKSVSLIGDFNYWHGLANPMRTISNSGIWEIFIPGISEGEKYKFQIKTHDGSVIIKSDPFAKFAEKRPKTASLVFETSNYQWRDSSWQKKKAANETKAMNIYEIHLGSWKKYNNNFPNYKDVAHDLAEYCKDMGFTHVELMPICEHPLDESWGYQVSGFFATTSRYGSPRDFQQFVDIMHGNDIGVIIDWVPAHFPNDSHALSFFDGTYLYEHADECQRIHPHWNTSIFNYGRSEVSNFLIASALFWIEVMHIDGIRVDAVASMLYLDYGREDKWIPNKYGGKENLEAIEFLKHLNAIVHERNPGTMMIAEESTSFCGVSHDLSSGGLGFDMKWNMGWMNDTLEYFCKDPIFRRYHHKNLTFGLLYAFSEKFVLSLSHDEVVHGKRSLISKMPGDYWQRFANLRLLYSYMICQPGKNLIFMGGEIGQWNEWNCKEEIEWTLLNYLPHQGIKNLVRDINKLSISNGALWEKDFDWQGFQWVNLSDDINSIISYKRKSLNQELLCIHNFTPSFFAKYKIFSREFDDKQLITEIFNTDSEKYGGSNKVNGPIKVFKDGIELQLPPLSTVIYEIRSL